MRKNTIAFISIFMLLAVLTNITFLDTISSLIQEIKIW